MQARRQLGNNERRV